MSSDCEAIHLQSYNSDEDLLGLCMSYDYRCICASSTFPSWFLYTICNECKGDGSSEDPLQLLIELCNNFLPATPDSYDCLASTSMSAATSAVPSQESTRDTPITTTTLSPTTLSTSISSPPADPGFPTTSTSNSTSLSTATSAPISLIPQNSSSNRGLSQGAIVGIGLGVAALSLAIIFLSCWAIWRRTRSNTYLQKDPGFTDGADMATSMASIYHDDDQQGVLYPRDGMGYQGNGSAVKEQLGFIPTVGIVNGNSGFVTPRYADGERGLEDLNAAERFGDSFESSGEDGIRYPAAEILETGNIRAMPNRYSGIGNLDLGQSELSHEELAQLEDEERRIDEAIRESERLGGMREERFSVDTAL